MNLRITTSQNTHTQQLTYVFLLSSKSKLEVEEARTWIEEQDLSEEINSREISFVGAHSLAFWTTNEEIAILCRLRFG